MVDVKRDFNAVGDGKTDDTRALANALDSVKDGGEIYFPAGIYLTTACLIFYSNQKLVFEKGATLLRGNEDDQRYILANHTSPNEGGYTACESSQIIGATFDGNAEIELCTTLMNTCHAKNILIKDCTFRNGCLWHFIEINSSEDVIIENCTFESSYSTDSERGEQIQLDRARDGNYGPIEDVNGEEIEFCFDNTVCRNVEIRNNSFYGYGFAPAIGNHDNAPHNHIKIHDNRFIGSFGRRGKIDFVELMHDVEIYDNTEI